MSQDEFNKRCAALLGRWGWKKRFSLATGISYATVKRWSAGHLPVPEYAASIVELLEGVPTFLRPKRWSR
jgi:hypothetical protein